MKKLINQLFITQPFFFCKSVCFAHARTAKKKYPAPAPFRRNKQLLPVMPYGCVRQKLTIFFCLLLFLLPVFFCR